MWGPSTAARGSGTTLGAPPPWGSPSPATNGRPAAGSCRRTGGGGTTPRKEEGREKRPATPRTSRSADGGHHRRRRRRHRLWALLASGTRGWLRVRGNPNRNPPPSPSFICGRPWWAGLGRAQIPPWAIRRPHRPTGRQSPAGRGGLDWAAPKFPHGPFTGRTGPQAVNHPQAYSSSVPRSPLDPPELSKSLEKTPELKISPQAFILYIFRLISDVYLCFRPRIVL
jgi:hypothetical protein